MQGQVAKVIISLAQHLEVGLLEDLDTLQLDQVRFQIRRLVTIQNFITCMLLDAEILALLVGQLLNQLNIQAKMVDINNL